MNGRDKAIVDAITVALQGEVDNRMLEMEKRAEATARFVCTNYLEGVEYSIIRDRIREVVKSDLVVTLSLKDAAK